MLNINIIKDKSDLYFQNYIKKHINQKDEENQKNKFYHFVTSLYQRVISNDDSDFSKEDLDYIKRYNIDISNLLDYFKVDIKNLYVESGKK